MRLAERDGVEERERGREWTRERDGVDERERDGVEERETKRRSE